MAKPKEATDSIFPEESVAPEAGKETPTDAPPPPEKQYRLYNVSGQTLYVVNVDGTITLSPGSYFDLPFSKISHHIKVMSTRGFLKLFEKEEEKNAHR
jgi:calcineurin-like phosphoesterase